MTQLNYTLIPPVSADKPQLIIQIDSPSLGKRILYRDTLLGFAKGAERELLLELIESELRFAGVMPKSDRIDTLPFNRVRIEPKSSGDIVRRIASTGRLFWKGALLKVDPLMRSPFHLRGTHQESGALLIEGVANLAEREVILSSCPFLFPAQPPWVIYEGVVYFLMPTIDWKWYALVHPAGQLLEGRRKEQFLEQFEERPPVGAPHLLIKGAEKEETKSDPMPLLYLKDWLGSTAELWVDYGAGNRAQVSDPTFAHWREEKIERAWEKDLIESGYSKKIVGDAHYFCPPGEVVQSLRFLLEMGWPVFDEKQRRLLQYKERSLALEEVGDSIEVTGKVLYENQEVDVKRLFLASASQHKFVDLGNLGVGLIDIEGITGMGEELILSHGRVKRSHFGALTPLLEKEHCRIAPSLEVLRRGIQPVSVGPGFQGTLYEYQQTGLNWLSFLYDAGFHGLLADEMGLGKTVQLLALLSRIDHATPTLIIAPTTLLYQWSRECKRFLPDLPVYLHRGGDRIKDQEKLAKQGIILTSYALLRHDFPLLSKLSFNCIILDEAQAIKNSESLAAQCARALKGRMRIAVTGTPVENRWEDMRSLFDFLIPELLRAPAPKNGSIATYLKSRLSPFIMRRTKEQVDIQLPPKYEQEIWIELEEEQRALYDSWTSRLRSGLLKKMETAGGTVSKVEILEGILRLRQLCCHPFLIDATSTTACGSAKLDRLLEDLEEAVQTNRKVLIYSQFTQMLQLIQKSFIEKGWNHLYLDGSTKERDEVIRAFQEEKEGTLLLISLKAGGVGLNLTEADSVILFEPWWNEAVENQAIARAHRLGREGAVFVRRYLVADSIEEKMNTLKKSKASLASEILDFNGEDAQFTADELLSLI